MLQTEIDRLESYIHQELKDVETTDEMQFIIEKVSRHESSKSILGQIYAKRHQRLILLEDRRVVNLTQ